VRFNAKTGAFNKGAELLGPFGAGLLVALAATFLPLFAAVFVPMFHFVPEDNKAPGQQGSDTVPKDKAPPAVMKAVQNIGIIQSLITFFVVALVLEFALCSLPPMMAAFTAHAGAEGHSHSHSHSHGEGGCGHSDGGHHHTVEDMFSTLLFLGGIMLCTGLDKALRSSYPHILEPVDSTADGKDSETRESALSVLLLSVFAIHQFCLGMRVQTVDSLQQAITVCAFAMPRFLGGYASHVYAGIGNVKALNRQALVAVAGIAGFIVASVLGVPALEHLEYTVSGATMYTAFADLVPILQSHNGWAHTKQQLLPVLVGSLTLGSIVLVDLEG